DSHSAPPDPRPFPTRRSSDLSPHGRELSVGIDTDPVFGPVVTLAAGGGMVALVQERAVGLPPLNEIIARDMIRRSRLVRLLQARSEEHTSELQSRENLVCRLL